MDAPLPSASDFNQLRAFVAVAGSLNFSRAAEKLGVSSSALTSTALPFTLNWIPMGSPCLLSLSVRSGGIRAGERRRD